MQACFFKLGPPNLGLSRQKIQRPQSVLKHASHSPHLVFLVSSLKDATMNVRTPHLFHLKMLSRAYTHGSPCTHNTSIDHPAHQKEEECGIASDMLLNKSRNKLNLLHYRKCNNRRRDFPQTDSISSSSVAKAILDTCLLSFLIYNCEIWIFLGICCESF